MKTKTLFAASLLFAASIAPSQLQATRLMGIQVVDKDYLMLHYRDGEVRYRDDATGPSAYLGHSFSEGDDTLKVFGPRLDAAIAARVRRRSMAPRPGRPAMAAMHASCSTAAIHHGTKEHGHIRRPSSTSAISG